MAPPTETKRWKIDGNPNDPGARWVPKKEGDKWTSTSTGDPDLKKIEGWIEDMEEWSKMMYEAVIKLGGWGAAPIAQLPPIAQLQQNVALLRQNVDELNAAVAEIKRSLPPVPQ